MKADSPLVDALRASPNFGSRAGGIQPDILLLHYTDMPTAEGAIAWLADPRSQVSCHYVVSEDGAITQMVAEADRAWHAGVSFWKGERDINSRSVGIEIANPGHDHGYPDFPEAQVEAVIALARDICARLGIRPERVLAHSDVSPGRKRDPGEKFPWARLAAAGIGHFTAPESIRSGRFFQIGDYGAPVEALQAMLVWYGYGLEIDGEFGAETEAVVAAFQRHFRPDRVDGVADASTIATLHRLSRGLTSLPAESAPGTAAT